MGVHKENQFVAAALVSLVLSACLSGCWHTTEDPSMFTFLSGLFSVATFIIGIMCWHISTLHPADSFGLYPLVCQYFVLLVSTLGTFKAHSLVSRYKRQPGEVQKELIMKILNDHKDTAYGKDFGFAYIKSEEDFRLKHPLTEYKHYEPYISRILDDGEDNVIMKEKTTYCLITSGTTGKNKKFPITNSNFLDFSNLILHVHELVTRCNPELGRYLCIRFYAKSEFSKAGIEMSPPSKKYLQHQPYHLSPDDLYGIKHEENAHYMHAVFGLAEPEVTVLDLFVPAFGYSFFITIEERWEQICDDIETGRISLKVEARDMAIVNKVRKHLKANPKRAAELRTEFNKGFHAIARRIWPRISCIVMTATGTFTLQAKVIMNSYGKGVGFYSADHTACEGVMGFCYPEPKGIDDITYMVPASLIYLEYIREDEMDMADPNTWLLPELELQQCYEIVLTNKYGLYRYRTGDVIRVEGFLEKMPVYSYCYRTGQMLNVYVEKLPENVFYKALSNSMSNWPEAELVDYTTVENHIYDAVRGKKSVTRHYVLFVEIKKANKDYVLSADEIALFDQNLYRMFELYRSNRDSGRIAPMEVIQIKNMGFDRLKKEMMETLGNSAFKMPRVLRNETYLKLLGENTLD